MKQIQILYTYIEQHKEISAVVTVVGLAVLIIIAEIIVRIVLGAIKIFAESKNNIMNKKGWKIQPPKPATGKAVIDGVEYSCEGRNGVMYIEGLTVPEFLKTLPPETLARIQAQNEQQADVQSQEAPSVIPEHN